MVNLLLGRIARQSPANSPSSNAAQLRLNRRNYAKQAHLLKRNAIVSATRIFNGPDGAPRIVTVIPLSEDANAKNAVSSLAQTLDISAEDCPESGLWRIRYALHPFPFQHSMTRRVEQIVSRLRFSFEQFHTGTSMRLLTLAKSQIMSSLFCPPLWKLTIGGIRSSARCKLRVFLMLSLSLLPIPLLILNHGLQSTNHCYLSLSTSSRLKLESMIYTRLPTA